MTKNCQKVKKGIFQFAFHFKKECWYAKTRS